MPFKETLFTGGSVSLAFYNNTFLIGASPVFGSSVTNWLDAGLVVNYNYTSYRDYQVFDDRLRQTDDFLHHRGAAQKNIVEIGPTTIRVLAMRTHLFEVMAC